MKWTHHRARVASLSRDRAPDDPELLAARRALAIAKLAADTSRRVAALGPLSADERRIIADALSTVDGAE